MTTPLPSILDSLKGFGYAVVPGVFHPRDLSILAAFNEATKEDQKAVGKKEHFSTDQDVIYCLDLLDPATFGWYNEHPFILDVVRKVLNDGPLLLSSFAASASGPTGGKRPHIDGRIPYRRLADETHISAMICLDDFTLENGAMNLWPGSHLHGQRPPEGLDAENLPGRIQAVAPRGSVIFFLGSTWHEVGQNKSGERRWGMILTYCRWWVKPTYDYTKCGEAIFNRLSDTQKMLYGFTSIPPTIEEGRHLTVTKEARKNYGEATVTKVTKYFATAEELKEIQDEWKQAIETPVMRFSIKDNEGMAGAARNIVIDKIHRLAEEHGCPRSGRPWGMNLQTGEFVSGA